MSFKTKLIRIIQRYAIYFIDPIFNNNHPNNLVIKITELLSFFILYFQPNDRWNIHIFVREWSKSLFKNVEGNKKNIFMFSCYRGQFSQDIILAIILANKGHKITLGYLPKLRSPIKAPLSDSKGAKEYLNYVMKVLEQKSKGKIICCDLTKFYKKKETSTKEYNVQALSDTVMMLQKENIDLQKDVDRKTYQFCLERLKFMDNSITNFFKDNNNFDLCLIANGASFENSQILKRVQKLKIPFNTYEKFAFKNARIITHEGPFHEFLDLDILLNLLKKNKSNHNKMKLNIQEKSQQLLLERKNSTGNYWGWKYQKKPEINMLTKDWLERFVQEKKYVLICPNVPFDAGYGSLNTIFPTMKQWLLETIKFILKNSDLMVIVRAHPAEDRESFGNEKTDLIIENSDIKSKRLIVIPSSSSLNTYELMDKCFFSSVYSSTTGVEIAMSGKLVVAGANIYHARVDVTKSSSSSDGYFKIIKSFINGTIKKSPQDIYYAHLVYFILHFALQLPYPYDKPSSMVQKPINKLFWEPEFSKFDLTFKILTMNKKEYTEFFKSEINKMIDVW